MYAKDTGSIRELSLAELDEVSGARLPAELERIIWICDMVTHPASPFARALLESTIGW
jgi:hypothetical protein